MDPQAVLQLPSAVLEASTVLTQLPSTGIKSFPSQLLALGV